MLFSNCKFPSNFNLIDHFADKEQKVKNEEDSTHIEKVLKLNSVSVKSDNEVNTQQENEIEKLSNEVIHLNQNYIDLKEAVQDIQFELVKVRTFYCSMFENII